MMRKLTLCHNCQIKDYLKQRYSEEISRL
jgi:hypothetical protein